MGQSDQPVVEFLHTTDMVTDRTDSGIKAIRAISASQAFRKYDWLRKLPMTNAAGNLRGMVVSSRWRTAFTVSSQVGEVVGNIAVVAGFAANLAESASRINSIYQSKDSWDIKASMISTQVSSAAIRTVGGVIPGAASLVFLSLQGYCEIGGAVGGAAAAQGVQKCVQGLKAADASVSSTFKKYTDGGNIYLWVNTYINEPWAKILK